MDCLKFAEGRGSPKGEFSRLSRARSQRAMIRSNILDGHVTSQKQWKRRRGGFDHTILVFGAEIEFYEEKAPIEGQSGERESPELLEACPPEHP
ncbi:hypothetical protein Acr_00g0035300 [Actinidia rufa]|uniref:Uncharacterized protein n=1 Tax=Actinidia rufa TaxID=165716 RepID=A0A7J0DGE7_9ERIC|nr:hypothetical protein Acr_00g0035300 [Actinidia rufa]